MKRFLLILCCCFVYKLAKSRALPARSKSPRWGWGGGRRRAPLRSGRIRPWWSQPCLVGVESGRRTWTVADENVAVRLRWVSPPLKRPLRRAPFPSPPCPAFVSVRRRGGNQTNSGGVRPPRSRDAQIKKRGNVFGMERGTKMKVILYIDAHFHVLKYLTQKYHMY